MGRLPQPHRGPRHGARQAPTTCLSSTPTRSSIDDGFAVPFLAAAHLLRGADRIRRHLATSETPAPRQATSGASRRGARIHSHPTEHRTEDRIPGVWIDPLHTTARGPRSAEPIATRDALMLEKRCWRSRKTRATSSISRRATAMHTMLCLCPSSFGWSARCRHTSSIVRVLVSGSATSGSMIASPR